MMNAGSLKLPRKIKCGGKSIDLRLMTPDDADAMVAFARALPDEDLQFLRTDITDPKVVARWVKSVEEGMRFTVLAWKDDELVGYGSLNRRDLSWMSHLGEIRVIVAPEMRSSGLGGILANDIFILAKEQGLTKIVAQMAREQKGARRLFQKLGFAVEALLADWVIDRSGATRDMIIMSFDVTGLNENL